MPKYSNNQGLVRMYACLYVCLYVCMCTFGFVILLHVRLGRAEQFNTPPAGNLGLSKRTVGAQNPVVGASSALDLTINAFTNQLVSDNYIHFTIPNGWRFNFGGSTSCNIEHPRGFSVPTSETVITNGMFRVKLAGTISTDSVDTIVTCQNLQNPPYAVDNSSVEIYSTRNGSSSSIVDKTSTASFSGIVPGNLVVDLVPAYEYTRKITTLTMRITAMTNALQSGDYIQIVLPSALSANGGGTPSYCSMQQPLGVLLPSGIMRVEQQTIQIRVTSVILTTPELVIECSSVQTPDIPTPVDNNVQIFTSYQGVLPKVDETRNATLNAFRDGIVLSACFCIVFHARNRCWTYSIPFSLVPSFLRLLF